jgi:uncharacterized Fe-S cluster protein YjdI
MSDEVHQSVFTYPGEAVDVTWDRRLCIHVGECTRAHGELFASGRTPWGEPDRAGADEVAEVVERCPTGALVHVRHDGGAAEVPPAENVIVVANSGPLYARGDLRIAGAPEDMPGVRTRCRPLPVREVERKALLRQLSRGRALRRPRRHRRAGRGRAERRGRADDHPRAERPAAGPG